LNLNGKKLEARGLWLEANQGMKDFKKLQIWQLGMEIVDDVYNMIPSLPSEERFGMKSQVTRAAVSVPANIAEGNGKRSEKDKKRFIEIALGSAFELETHLIIVKNRKWVEEKLIDELIEKVLKEQRMIDGFIDKLGE
jgi:four helix bundle protein